MHSILNSDGFSLLEVMLAGAILIIGIVGLLPAFSSGMKHNSRAKAWVDAATLAQDTIEKIKAGIPIADNGEKGKFSWNISESTPDLPGIEEGQLTRYIVTISWPESGRVRSEKFIYLKKEGG